MKLYVALIHYPVLDRLGNVITTAVTNLDVHDIARTARTYDVQRYFIVTPIDAQRRLVQRILEHWREGSGAARVPERGVALQRCEHRPSLAEVLEQIETTEGAPPMVLATSARVTEGSRNIAYPEARAALAERPGLLLFGTGHGLLPADVRAADGVLPAIRQASDYNHLSVRAAVAITLDRLIDRA